MWKKQVQMRQPSAVKGVSGQTIWRRMDTIIVRQDRSTIMPRRRLKALLETAFASTKPAFRRLKAMSSAMSGSRAQPVMYLSCASKLKTQSLKKFAVRSATLAARIA